MVGQSSAGTRLCPHCANSVAADAAECFYCKADFSSEAAPEWLRRDDSAAAPRSAASPRRVVSLPSKLLWPGALVIVALLAFFAGGYLKREDQSRAQANLKQLQAKDLVIQSQEGQLAQTRQKLEEASSQLAEMKTKLEESRKEISLAQQRVDAARQTAASAHRSAASTRVASRAPAPAPYPQPVSTRQPSRAGIYETTRPTSVHEDPSSSSRVISQIERGTRINVVGNNGGWLEVRSRRGNPPGYVRADDARPSGAVN